METVLLSKSAAASEAIKDGGFFSFQYFYPVWQQLSNLSDLTCAKQPATDKTRHTAAAGGKALKDEAAC